MSAFMCSEDHINYLVTAWTMFARQSGVHYRADRDADSIGAELVRENQKSILYRYYERFSDMLEVGCYKHTPFTAYKVSAVETLKLIACFEYQANEHEGWEESKAHEFCADLRELAIQMLPGYNEAPWGI